MDELKPCPFCGDEAYISFDGNNWYVYCFNCGASISHPQIYDYSSEAMKKGRNKAIEKWNKRV